VTDEAARRRAGANLDEVTTPTSAWHALRAPDCAALLDVAPERGLDPDEAARRAAASGPNRLPETRGPGRLALFAAQFRSPLVALLAASLAALLAMGELVDAAAIAAILVLNAALGYAQERRAADELAALRRMSAPNARVRRGGADAVVPAADVVPGDVVIVEAGDRVPADLRLFRSAGFRTVEASLTGESEPVDKDAESVAPAAAPVADRRGMAWMGTIAVAGTAEGVVVATGARAEFGRIAALVQDAETPATPLQTRLAAFGRTLAVACGIVLVVVFALGVARGVPVVEMVLAAVSLAVAAVPEGLPAVVTIALAHGVSRMAERHALIRRLPAVETLGCATVICADKTGTLTVGEMTLRTVASLDFEATVEGEGYRAVGAIRGDLDAVRRVLRAAAACSTARVVEKDGAPAVAGDPTEGAIVVAAAKAGIDVERMDRESPAVGGVPFDAARRRMSVVRDERGTLRAYVKGAAEAVVPRCASIAAAGRVVPFDDDARRRLVALNEELAARGLRVLAVADRDVASAAASSDADLTLLGLVGIVDPPRPSARAAVAACAAAGLRTVMITGDQPATALAIARQIGIARDADELMTGPDLDATSDEALKDRVPTVAVYARVSPEHKLRIVKAWRARGDVVAMTGDGVNDAPALKAADIGVAMGRGGTDVAKEASAMVVTDDDFASIVSAVEEGRRIYENIRKTLLYLIGANLSEILVVAAALTAGLPLPLLPLQLLWINLVTDGLPALALATDPADADVLARPPRPPGSEIVDRAFVAGVVASALLVAAATFAGFLLGLGDGRDAGRARSYAFSILVVAEVLIALAARSRTRTLFEIGALSNARLFAVVAFTIALQFVCDRTGLLDAVLRTGRLSWTECAMVLALGAIPVTALETWKLARRARPRREGETLR